MQVNAIIYPIEEEYYPICEKCGCWIMIHLDDDEGMKICKFHNQNVCFSCYLDLSLRETLRTCGMNENEIQNWMDECVIRLRDE